MSLQINNKNIIKDFQYNVSKNNNEFIFESKKLTILTDNNNNPWFVGKQVAEILGYDNTVDTIKRHVDIEDKINYNKNILTACFTLSADIKHNSILINESGLYSLILSSKLPTAKAFKRWVTSEVLPQIRKNGEYKLQQQLQLHQQQLLKLEQDKKELENENKQLEQSKQELIIIKEKEKQELTNIIKEQSDYIAKLSINNSCSIVQKFYVITKKQYSKEGYFKCGKTMNEKKRKSSYDTSAPDIEGQNYFYTSIIDIPSIESYELYIGKLLNNFKQNPHKEFFRIRYPFLMQLINISKGYHIDLCSMINAEIENLRNTINEKIIWDEGINYPQTAITISIDQPQIIIDGNNITSNITDLNKHLCHEYLQDITKDNILHLTKTIIIKNKLFKINNSKFEMSNIINDLSTVVYDKIGKKIKYYNSVYPTQIINNK